MGAAAATSGGASVVSVGNSALFSATNESLSRSQGSGSNTVWTFSSWIYKCESKNQVFLQSGGSPAGQLGWDTSDRLYIYNGATVVALTTQVFRDIGWYHIHIAYNTSALLTAKVKLSVNGSLVSVFTTDNRSSASAFNGMNQSGQTLTVGNNGSTGDTICLSGYMAETVLLDGTAAEPTSFGAYDSSGLYWTPLSSTTIKALTFGTNGFYLDNTTNAQTDASGEGNNFTNNNTVVTTTNTPTNIEALFNPINTTFTASAGASLSNGNRSFSSASGYRIGVVNLNFPKTGKWWVAVEYAASPAVSNAQFVGITRGAGSSSATNSYLTYNQNDYSYTYQSNGYIIKGSASSSNVTTGLTAPCGWGFYADSF